MSKVYDLLIEIDSRVQELLETEFQEVRPEEIGLDPRSGYHICINRDYIVVSKGSRRSLEYYGGFEYVDKEHVIELGDYIFYSADDERVQDHLDEFFLQEKE